MAAIVTPFAFTGTLQLPADATLPPDPIPFVGASGAQSIAQEVLTLTGAGTQVVPFGTVGGAGAKGVFVRYDAQSGAQPIQLLLNGSTQNPIELSPGGMLAYVSPAPTAGLQSLSVSYASGCQVRIWVLG